MIFYILYNFFQPNTQILGKLFSEEIKIGDVDVDSIDLLKRLRMELKRKVKVNAFKNNVTILKKNSIVA